MQTEFLARPETEVFFGGEAGGGKSFALLIDATRYCARARYTAVIFRRTYPDLEDLMHKAINIYCAPGLEAKFNASKHLFTFPTGARIKFSHLQHIKDIYSHQGQEYDYIGFDELPQFPKLAYTYLFSRLRGPDPEIERYIRGTGNPDGEGLLWVKSRFIDPLEPLETGWFLTSGDFDRKVARGTPESVSRAFIPSIRQENRALMDADPNYEARLNQLPEQQKRALKFGIWQLFDRPEQLIKSEWWQAAVDGKNKRQDENQPFAIGADFAHMGDDKSVIILGRGNRPFKATWWPQTRTTEFAEHLIDAMKPFGYQVRAAVDTVGPGAGVYDDITKYHQAYADRVEAVTHKDDAFDWQYVGKVEFDNVRSQMLWKLRQDFEAGAIDLSAFKTEEGWFEHFGTLQEEALAHTYKIQNGKLKVIPKDELKKAEKLGRSPDFLDALALWNWVRDGHGLGSAWAPPAEAKHRDYGIEEFEASEDAYTAEGAYT